MCALLCGCEEYNKPRIINRGECEGHNYLVIHTFSNHPNVIHDPDCRCLKRQVEKELGI